MAIPSRVSGMAENSEEADREAMRRLSSGDDLALNELMERWKQPLINYLFRHLGHEHEAVDLAQETFVRIYENRLRYRADGKFSSWLFTIATNLYRNHVRWKSRHPTVSLSEPSATDQGLQIPDSSLTSEETVLKKERHREVWHALQELPSDLKTSLILFEFEDKSHQEIAQILSCTKKAVETRIYRARKILQEKLKRWL